MWYHIDIFLKSKSTFKYRSINVTNKNLFHKINIYDRSNFSEIKCPNVRLNYDFERYLLTRVTVIHLMSIVNTAAWGTPTLSIINDRNNHKH